MTSAWLRSMLPSSSTTTSKPSPFPHKDSTRKVKSFFKVLM
jgi:hypothetical protein